MISKIGSHFEQNLLKTLTTKLRNADFTIDQKLLICAVCDTFDNFESGLEQVYLQIGVIS